MIEFEKKIFLENEKKILKDEETENNLKKYKQIKKENYLKIIENLKLQIDDMKNSRDFEIKKSEQLMQEYEKLAENYKKVIK